MSDRTFQETLINRPISDRLLVISRRCDRTFAIAVIFCQIYRTYASPPLQRGLGGVFNVAKRFIYRFCCVSSNLKSFK
jgi:hypothetical protein